MLAQLTQASTTLRTEASSLGSNLSIVRDPPGLQQEPDQRAADRRLEPDGRRSNEEAANSQALSTRQSIAVSALALANQSQQSVLQLLR